jgi:hypothetical protein
MLSILHTEKITAVQKGDGRCQINHEAEAYDDDMTLNFEQLLKLTLFLVKNTF